MKCKKNKVMKRSVVLLVFSLMLVCICCHNKVDKDKYDYVGSFFEGLADVELNGKHGFIDKSGKAVIPLKYDDVWYFSEGLAGVNLNSKWGL
jgi:hypothetical protein